MNSTCVLTLRGSTVAHYVASGHQEAKERQVQRDDFDIALPPCAGAAR